MDSHPSSDRLTRSLVAAAVLGAICLGYVTLSSRWLDVERSKQKRMASRSKETAHSVADESVMKWFPKDAWVRTAGKSFRDGRRYLFCNRSDNQVIDVEGDSDTPGMAVTLSPIAMLWKNDDPTVSPIVATADEARLNLSKPLSLQQPADDQSSERLRIVSGWLTGNVVIQGPKRLKITGQEFYVDEAAMTLRSLRPVEFHFDGHSGGAEGGVEIALQRDGSDKGKGLTSVNGISVVKLRGPVNCDLVFDDRRNQDPVHLTINAPSEFEFDPQTNVGTFFGQLGGGTETERHVTVTRFTQGRPDLLLCPKLMVEFHPRINPTTGAVESSRLELGRVSARGNSHDVVRFLSPDNDVDALMRQLDYNVGARQLDMYGSLQENEHEGFENLRLKIEQADREMRVPHLRVLHSEDNQVERIECVGYGQIEQAGSPSEDDDRLTAGLLKWTRHLHVQRQPDGRTHTITVDGNARVSLPERRMKLSGRTINLTVQTTEAPENADAASRDPAVSLNMTDAQPEKLVAEGNVIMRSPQASGEISRQLTVYFGTKQDKLDVSVVSQSRTQGPSPVQASSRDSDQGHTTFRGQEMTVHMLMPEAPEEEHSWQSVRISGDVEVTHRGADSADHYTAVGSTFIAKNGLGDLADISLLGNPAELLSRTGTVMGAKIDLHQAEDVAEINSPGQLRLIMDQDFDGKKLPSPVPMDVWWTDSMKVQGTEARFIGGVRIELDDVQYSIDDEQLHDTEILTPELKVLFAEPLTLSGRNRGRKRDRGDDAATGTPTIQTIQCVGETVIHRDSFAGDRRVGILKAKLADLTVSPETGAFHAIGPGVIESTNTTTSDSRPNRLRPESRIRVKANTKTEINELPFARVKALFIGQMEGNLNNRDVMLKYSVNIAYTPVDDLEEVIDLESMPADKMPEDSRILQAEEVHITAIPGSDGEEFSMKAVGNARLESRDLSGDADIITYDHSKSQIVLTGEDDRLVNGHHRPGGTGQYNELNGPWFEYNIRTRQLRARTVSLKAD